jgi:hypothetical protein
LALASSPTALEALISIRSSMLSPGASIIRLVRNATPGGAAFWYLNSETDDAFTTTKPILVCTSS